MEDKAKGREQLLRELIETRQRAGDAKELCGAILTLTKDPIVLYDMEGKVKYLSPSFTKVFGWTLQELEGQRIDFVPESERAPTAEVIQLIVFKGGTLTSFETKRYSKDRRLLDINIAVTTYRDHQGNTAGTLVILHDMTAENRMAAELKIFRENLDQIIAQRLAEATSASKRAAATDARKPTDARSADAKPAS
jgi:PAS domain S-box-containing protein